MVKCACYEETVELKPMSSFEQGMAYAKTGKLEYLKREKVCRCQGTKEKDLCDCGGDKRKCDFYEYIRKEGIREAYQTKEDLDLLYCIRTNMTSITRYVFNKNKDKDGEYRELAKKAVNNILLKVNGKGIE